MKIYDDPAASGGRHIVTDAGIGNNSDNPPAPAGIALIRPPSRFIGTTKDEFRAYTDVTLRSTLLCEALRKAERYVARADSVWALLVSISIKVKYSVFAARLAQKIRNKWYSDLTGVVPYQGDGGEDKAKNSLSCLFKWI